MTLLEAFKNKDEQEIEQACKRLFTNPTVIGKINKMRHYYNVLDEPTDEILQEGVIRLYENILLGKFRGDSQESTYLISICQNYIRDKLKKTSKERITDYQADAGKLKLLDREALMVAHPADLKITDEETEQLKKVLQQEKSNLSEICQEALAGYYEKGLSMALLADLIQLKNKNQAKKKVHTCREHLRKVLFNNPLVKSILNF